VVAEKRRPKWARTAPQQRTPHLSNARVLRSRLTVRDRDVLGDLVIFH
jgi:hypothetical protein